MPNKPTIWNVQLTAVVKFEEAGGGIVEAHVSVPIHTAMLTPEQTELLINAANMPARYEEDSWSL